LAVSPGPHNFVAAIKMGDRDLLGENVEFYPGSLPLQVIFDSKGGAVRGTVEDCSGATVVLTPTDPKLQQPQFVQTAKCADGGSFDISNLRPGDYHAFAFERWEGPLELLSGFDQTLINRAVNVHVKAGET